VLDASAVVRALVGQEGEAARQWLAAVAEDRIHALVPDLMYAESANALAQYTRAGHLVADTAEAMVRAMCDFPFEVTSLRALAPAASAVALARAVTIYDACYLALAEAREATLVTADRRLAAAATASALLPDARPPA
jgi:predicted nucleic acid-binding protein